MTATIDRETGTTVHTGTLTHLKGRFQPKTWSTDDPASVEAVRREFDALISAGNAAFAVQDTAATKSGTDGGTTTREFDPEAHEIVVFAPMAGG